MGEQPAYAIVAGHGRSGTNWLLDLFDRNSATFCRNEPYGALESRLGPYSALWEHRFVVRAERESLETGWDEAVRSTLARMGQRDRPIPVRKQYVSELARGLGATRLVAGPRARAALSALLPSLRREEWDFPRWLGSRESLTRAFGVLKLVASPGWVHFVLERRPDVAVFQIVRHPGGYLNSWARRYVRNRNAQEILDANRERLRDIVGAGGGRGAWAQRFGEIDRLSLDESELWYWRYANQTIHEAGAGLPGYRAFAYESLTRDPIGIMRSVYARCGLPWTAQSEREIAITAGRSRAIASAWRDELEPAQIALAERFLAEASAFYPPDEGRADGGGAEEGGNGDLA